LHRTSWLEFIGFSLILSSLFVARGLIGGLGMVLIMQAGGLIVVFDRAKRRSLEQAPRFDTEKGNRLFHVDRSYRPSKLGVVNFQRSIEHE